MWQRNSNKLLLTTANARAMKELYEELETQEGERKIFRIAKARDIATTDFTHMKQINNEHGVVLRDLDIIIGRWKWYFDMLLNEENPRSIFEDEVPTEDLPQEISRNEVKVAISRRKNGKATGMDGIPLEVWKCLGEEGIDTCPTLGGRLASHARYLKEDGFGKVRNVAHRRY